jgi:hypothetical protein
MVTSGAASLEVKVNVLSVFFALSVLITERFVGGVKCFPNLNGCMTCSLMAQAVTGDLGILGVSFRKTKGRTPVYAHFLRVSRAE